MSFVLGLKCRECARTYPKEILYVCEYCFGSLEVVYDYAAIRRAVTREEIARRPHSLWRYRELLPLDAPPTVGHFSGFTPLLRAHRLGKVLGVEELWIKDDSVSHPTLSFKDRVVAVALSKAREFGFETVACASTGNLANAVSALGAWAGLQRYIFTPADLELGKVVASLVYGANLVAVNGTYDEVNRLCTEVATKYRWAFVNINIRPYYAEGSKTFGYEIAEQLGWRTPDQIVVPVAGGSLISKIWKAFKELKQLGWLPEVTTRVFAAQAEGCAPVVRALQAHSEIITPVKPQTIAKSLAIGNPADGYYAMATVTESGGAGEMATDEEIVEAIQLLAQTEGIFTETAGGVTLAVTRKLLAAGQLDRRKSLVLSITGNGLKTQEPLVERLRRPRQIAPTLAAFEQAYGQALPANTTPKGARRSASTRV